LPSKLRATNATGGICIRNLSFLATPGPPAILTASLNQAGGQFGFTFQGPAGSIVTVEASPDLGAWITIGTLTNLTGTATFTDTAPGLQRRFYRLRQQ
jgi:hypothetical protein